MSGRAQLASYLSLGAECRGVRHEPPCRSSDSFTPLFFCGMRLVLGSRTVVL